LKPARLLPLNLWLPEVGHDKNFMDENCVDRKVRKEILHPKKYQMQRIKF